MASSHKTTQKKSAPAKGRSQVKSTGKSSSRTTGSAGKKKSTAPGAGGKKAGSSPVKKELWILFGLALAAILFLSLLGLMGAVGRTLAAFQFGLFGSLAYLFPFLLLLLLAFILMNCRKYPANTWLRVLLALLTFSFLCGIAEMAGSGGDLLPELKAYYALGQGDRFHGGFFGGLWCRLLQPAVGTVGSYLILIVLFLAGLVLSLGRALLIPLGMKSRQMAHAIRDESQRYKAAGEERRALAQIRAEERLERRAAQREARARAEEAQRAALRRQLDERLAERGKKQPLEFKEVKYRKEEPEQMKLPTDPLDITDLSGPTLPSAALLDTLMEEMESHQSGGISKEKRTLGELGDLEREKTPPKIGQSVKKGETPKAGKREKEEPRINFMKDNPPREEIKVEIASSRPKADKNDFLPPLDREDPLWADPRDQLQELLDQPEERIPGEKKPEPRQTAVLRPAAPTITEDGSLPEAALRKKEYRLPPAHLLKRERGGSALKESSLKETAALLENTLRTFGVEVSVTDISCGPSVIRYEMKPELGVKISRISALADDIKLALAASDIRIEAPIPGKSAVGIEVPNPEKQTVYLRTIVESEELARIPSKLAFAVGQDIGGQIIVADLAKMPHLLVAGTTGSGKSVFLNSLILSILYRAKPEEVQLIMVDPKQVELVDYNGIPHLRIPVVTDPKLAAEALNGAVKEMTGRYKKFADLNVRDIRSYNAKIRENPEEYADREVLPQIVIIVDEFADLMMTASKDVEQAVVRLAQLARAAGIHLVIATQRPTANVITGLIKANIQSRVALTVSSGTDSRVILDMVGAERLLGHGDMLFYPTGVPKPMRVQGCWVSDDEIEQVTNFWKKQGSVSEEEMARQNRSWMNDPVERERSEAEERDELFLDAAKYIIDSEKASIGNLQRVFRIGFNRAARIMDQLADAGIVGKEEGTKARQILMDRDQLEDWKRENGR